MLDWISLGQPHDEENLMARASLAKHSAQAFLVAVLTISAASASAVQRYRVTDLGTPPGSCCSIVAAVNDRGWTTGDAIFDALDGPFPLAYISKGSVIKALDPFGDHYSLGSAINNRGWIAGTSYFPGGTRAFLYNGQTFKDLGSLGGEVSYARGLNNKGWVVGESQDAAGLTRPFLYDGASMRDLGSLGGGGGHEMKDLGQIGATDEGYTGVAINERGWVAGIIGDVDGKQHAFLYDGSRMRDLGLFRGYGTVATAINSRGWVVGYGGTYPDPVQLALLFRNGRKLDLNQHLDASGAGWILHRAFGINGSGQIVGYGLLNGEPRSFLLTPVRDPATPATQADK
jgi:probable HAF family extracellular repeat protein